MRSLLRWSAEPRLPGEHMHSSHLVGTPEDTRNLHPHIDRTSAASVPARIPRGTSPPSPGSLGQRGRTRHALSGRRCLTHTLTPKLPAATDRFGAGGWVEQGNRPDSWESLPRNPPTSFHFPALGLQQTSSPQSTPHTIPPSIRVFPIGRECQSPVNWDLVNMKYLVVLFLLLYCRHV